MRCIMAKFNYVAVLLLLSHATLGAIGQEGAPPPALTGGQSAPPAVAAGRASRRRGRPAQTSADSTEQLDKIQAPDGWALDSDVQWRDGATHVASSRTSSGGKKGKKGVTLVAKPSPPMAERASKISQSPEASTSPALPPMRDSSMSLAKQAPVTSETLPEAPWSPAAPFSPDAPGSPELSPERAQDSPPPLKSSSPAAPWSPDVSPETDYDFTVPAPPFYPDAPWSPDAPWAPKDSSEVPRDSTSPEQPCTPDEFGSPERSPEPSSDVASPEAPCAPDALLGSPDLSGGAASPSTSPAAPWTSSPRARRSDGSEISSPSTSDVQISTELRGQQLIVTLTRFPTDEDVERNLQLVTHKYAITLPDKSAGPLEVLHTRAAPVPESA